MMTLLKRLLIHPMCENNATLKIDFTDPRKRNFKIFFICWIGNDTPATNKGLTSQFK